MSRYGCDSGRGGVDCAQTINRSNVLIHVDWIRVVIADLSIVCLSIKHTDNLLLIVHGDNNLYRNRVQMFRGAEASAFARIK